MTAQEGICGTCGATVERGGDPFANAGWYGGHYYQWGAIGRTSGPVLVKVRCSNCWALDRRQEDAELAGREGVTLAELYAREDREEAGRAARERQLRERMDAELLRAADGR